MSTALLTKEKTETRQKPRITETDKLLSKSSSTPAAQTPLFSETPEIPAVFARCESKYLIDYSTCDALIQSLGSQLVADKRGSTLIRNLYLDTSKLQLIRRSIDKPHYKEKLRVRTYGQVDSFEHPSFVEIKKKLDGQVYKRRSSMSLASASQLIVTGIAGPSRSHTQGQSHGNTNPSTNPSTQDALNAQIIKELEWTLELYKPIQPAITVNYQRCSYNYPGSSGDVRITIDCNVAYKQGDWQDFLLDANSPDYKELLPEQTCIMEIKALQALPLELTHALSNLGILPTSFSKVGAAYQDICSLKREQV